MLASSATLLLGFSGSGKTLLTQHFLHAGAEKDEPGLYFGFYEPPERLIESAEHVGLTMRQHVESGMLELMWQPALKYGLDQLAERLLADVQQRSVRRVVIDGIDGFRQGAAFPERTMRFVTALTTSSARSTSRCSSPKRRRSSSAPRSRSACRACPRSSTTSSCSSTWRSAPS